MASSSYSNVFERSKNLKTRFTALWQTRDGETLNVSGMIKRIGGDVFGIAEVQTTLLGGKPAGRAVNESLFTASSARGVEDKLRQHFQKVGITRDIDPLKIAMEKEARERNRGSAHTERTVSREPVAPAPEPKKIFGIDESDTAALRALFDAVFFQWAVSNKDLAEFSDVGKTPEQIAIAQTNVRKNLSQMTARLVDWARRGKISVLDLRAVKDAEVFLRQRHNWFGQRKRGEPMASEYVAPSEPSFEPEEPAFNPRTATFEELQQRVVAERRKTMALKNLKGDEFTK